MKKKENLVKRFFIYVFSLFALSICITGCASYDEDIDDIYKQLKSLQEQINAIKTQIETGHYVVAVSNISNGVRITFNKGEVYEIVSGKDGTDGVQWNISNVDSMWYKDGVQTAYRAIPRDGKQGDPGIQSPSPAIYKESDAKYYWVVYKWEEASRDFTPDTLWNNPINNYNTYTVDKGSYYELNVWVEDTPGNGKYDVIKLPKTFEPAGSFLEFLGFEHIKTSTRPVSLANIKDSVEFQYWYLPTIRNGVDGTDTSKWVGRVTVEERQVLTTLKRDSVAAIIRTNLSKTAWTLTLKDSQGGSLPVSFENPVKHTGQLTKAGNDSIYILQMNGTKDKYANTGEYSRKFKTSDNVGFVFSLTDMATGINSGYKALITPVEGNYTLQKAAISTIGGKSGTGTGIVKNEYQVGTGADLGIKFTDDSYLYDYYVEAADSTQAVDKFGLTVNKTNGTFRITKADEEQFKLIVYTLYYNGIFFPDTVFIKP
ncbi:MAG: hypothetical protein LBJ60_05355 [Tannerellaceae bacterium]|jgi:hypothetical protein|nr:hypothetical protein [Tannerellaceae bacterium]